MESLLMTNTLADILGYVFTDQSLMRQALTHPSHLNEQRENLSDSYQRLEFLGDAVLGLVLADLLSARFPDADEGDLSRLRSQMADQAALSATASKIGIAPFILLGKGEERASGREKPSILADVLEALIGAVYRDGGYQQAFLLVGRLFGPMIDEAANNATLGDAKSALQEWLAARRMAVPVYKSTGESGPPHARLFQVSVEVGGELAGVGEGHSKKVAQQAAARVALDKLLKNS